MDDVQYLYRIAAIARKLGVSRDTLKHHIRKGKVPAVMTACGIFLVSESDVLKWKRKQEAARREDGYRSYSPID